MNKKESYSPLKKTKADRLSKRLDRLEKRLEKSGIEKSGNAGYTGDSRREMRYRKTDRKAGAAAGYGNMDEAKSTAKLDKTLAKKGYKRSPLKKTIAGKIIDYAVLGYGGRKIRDAITGADRNETKEQRMERIKKNNPKRAERIKGREARKEARQAARSQRKETRAKVTEARQTNRKNNQEVRLAKRQGKTEAKSRNKIERIEGRRPEGKTQKQRVEQAKSEGIRKKSKTLTKRRNESGNKLKK